MHAKMLDAPGYCLITLSLIKKKSKQPRNIPKLIKISYFCKCQQKNYQLLLLIEI